MMNMSNSEIRELAERHWLYTEKVIRACGKIPSDVEHILYIESFCHGVKHGQELNKEN